MTSRARYKVREPSIAALVRELRVAALVLRDWKKKINKSKPRFRVNRIPR